MALRERGHHKTKKEGIMERKQKPQAQSDARPDREKVKLDRRYGEIGISAVKAAVRPQQVEPPRSDPNSSASHRRRGGGRGL